MFVTTEHNHVTTLHMVCAHGKGDSHDIIKLLLDSGLDCNARTSIDHVTPLHYALTESDSLDDVRLLLDRGADIRAVDYQKSNALHFAARNERVDIVEFILTQGFDINGVDSRGFTALHNAASVGNSKVCEFLLRNGARIDKKGSGYTPMALTLGHGSYEETVKVLLRYGAKPMFRHLLNSMARPY